MVSKTQKFIAAWYGHQFESSCSTTREFAKFAREFKAVIKEQIGPNDELVNFSRSHFYCSGFVRRGRQFVYFSISDVRYFSTSWADRVLVRTAKHEKDYTGGFNQQTELQNFGAVTSQIFEHIMFVTIK